MNALFSTLSLGAAAILLAGAPNAQQVRATGPSLRSRPGYAPSHTPTYSSSRIWVSGGTRTVLEHVWIPGGSERIWVEPVWTVRLDSCGNRLHVLLSAGHWETAFHPGHYELRPVQRRLPGRWVARGSCN